MDSKGGRKIDGMGQNVIQAREIKILGLKERESSGQPPVFHIRNTNLYHLREAW